MSICVLRVLGGLWAVTLFAASTAYATTVPYVEDFSAGAAEWRDNPGTSVVTWQPSGGPDGGAHVQTAFSLATAVEGDTPVLFRAHDEWGSSGGSFEGDWMADGVALFTFQVRHDAPFPLTFFARFSGPGNFPGAVAVNFAPVLPQTWTTISIPIDPANPQFISFEGQSFAATFTNVGHLQLGVSVSAGQGGYPVPINFELDKVAVLDCIPQCGGKECGDDGCGGFCGACPDGSVCGPSGLCVEGIPAASTWGLVVLGLSLAAAAKVHFRPRRSIA